MKKIILYTFLVATFSLFAQQMNAQTVAAVNPENKYQLTEAELQEIGAFGAGGRMAARTFDNRYEGIKGSPLWLELGFKRALVKFKDKEEIVDLDANLDLEAHMLYLRMGKTGQIFKIKPSKVMYVDFQDGTYPFYSIRNKEMGWDNPSYAFAQLIYQNKYSFVKATNKIFKKADFKDPYSSGTTYDEYQQKETYWISLNGRTYKQIKLGKKGFQKAIPKKAKQISKIAKDEKLDLKNEADIKLLLQRLELNSK